MERLAKEKLRKLARLVESRFPFLSVYLDTKKDLPQKYEQVRIFLKNQVRESESLIGGREERESFDRDVERLITFVDGLRTGSAPDGHAIFACSGDGVFEVIQTRRPFQNQFLVSNRPLIRQLAVFLTEYEPVVAAVLDSRSARIFEIILGDAISEVAVEADLPHAPQVPQFHGWGDLKYQRDVKGKIEQHWKEVADYLSRQVDRGYRRIVLLGQDATVVNFRKQLPKRVDDRVIATSPMDRREAKDRVVSRVFEIVAAEERRRERETVSLIRDQALSGNLGVFGLEDTLEALRKGQVYKVAIAAEMKARGWRCRACGALATHLRRDACPHCGGACDVVELGDELVKDALAGGAEIETVRDSAQLARMGNVGALLRFRE